LVFIDESGFLLIPTKRKTWGPQGQTPVIRYCYRHDRMSALAALTVSAQRHRMGLYTRFQQDNFNAADFVHFLRMLLSHVTGPVILLWDRLAAHKSAARQLQARFPRLHIEYFPAYAPELNPVEWIWQDFNRHTANSLLRDKSHLRQRLHANRRRVSHTQAKLRSFVAASHLPSAPWQDT
jgi:transposase